MRSLRMVSWSASLLMGILIAVLSVGWSTEAPAGVVFSSPDLPPESNPADCETPISVYWGAHLDIIYPGPIVLNNPVHRCFQNVLRQDVAGDEHETFDSILEGLIDLGSGPVPVTLTGPVEVMVFDKTGHTTGTFDTEIVSMSLTGSVGGTDIDIRESPTLQSQGETTIADLGGGVYEIDSFFDVFTELSVGGGPWQPQTSPAVRIVLVEETTAIEPRTWGRIKILFR